MGDTITLRELRDITGEPSHVINHALDRHGPKPAGRIGLIRFWRKSDLAEILEALAKTAVHRNGRASKRETVGT